MYVNSFVSAQNSQVKPETAPSNQPEANYEQIQVQITPNGYISLPRGYWAFMDANYMDAWGGLIESLNGDFWIRFSDGIIVSVFDGEDKNIKWRKELKT